MYLCTVHTNQDMTGRKTRGDSAGCATSLADELLSSSARFMLTVRSQFADSTALTMGVPTLIFNYKKKKGINDVMTVVVSRLRRRRWNEQGTPGCTLNLLYVIGQHPWRSLSEV